MREKQIHNFEPVFDEKSRILILGTFPSVKSREQGFYYGHKQNRFWKVISIILNEELPQTIEGKKRMLKRHNIALWDVASSCEIENSSDSSMKNVEPNDIGIILSAAQIEHIFLNGKTAGKLFEKFFKEKFDIPFEIMPSTSPANAVFSLERLRKEWNRISKFI